MPLHTCGSDSNHDPQSASNNVHPSIQLLTITIEQSQGKSRLDADAGSIFRAGSHVEAKRRNTGFGWCLSDCLDEFVDCWKFRQFYRVVDQVTQGNEGVGFSAAIGEFELADRLVVFACYAEHHIPY